MPGTHGRQKVMIKNAQNKNMEDRKVTFINVKIADTDKNPFEEWKNKKDKILYQKKLLITKIVNKPINNENI